MKTTGSSKCLIRKKIVALTPEERVRQSVLLKMVHELGYPKGLISVERAVSTRRTDIVCYTKEMTPLLLIECKAGAIQHAALSQVLGYNEKIGAPFICLVNEAEEKIFWYEKKERKEAPFIPKFDELYAISKRL